MKTSELIGPALDWAVAKCEGLDFEIDARLPNYPHIMLADKNVWGERRCVLDEEDGGILFCPTTDWSQGGPIIDRESIELRRYNKHTWMAEVSQPGLAGKGVYAGPTPLIAAMRCHIAHKLGDEVEVPGELK
jgi:hypothetical protein